MQCYKHQRISLRAFAFQSHATIYPRHKATAGYRPFLSGSVDEPCSIQSIFHSMAKVKTRHFDVVLANVKASSFKPSDQNSSDSRYIL